MGISNREWLYSLDVADLAEWFDAEHVDDAISENLGLSQDSEIDSREKLESDVRQLAFDYAPSSDSSDEYALRAKVMKLLDRQAAITKRELCKQQETLAQRMIVDGYEFELFEMRKQISELTAERDELQERVDTLTRYIHEIKQIARKV